MAIVDDLQVKIQGDAVKANDAIDKLVGKLNGLSGALSGLSNAQNLSAFSKGVSDLSVAMTGMSNLRTTDFTRLTKNIQKLSSLDSTAIGNAAGSISQFTSSLGTLNSLNVSDSALKIGELAKGISSLGYKSSTKAIQNIPQLAMAMHQLMTTLSSAPQVSQNIISMTNALASLARTGASSGRAANSLSGALNSYSSTSIRATKHTFSLASAIGKLYATYWIFIRAFGKLKEAIDISSQLTEVQNVVNVTFGDMSYKIEEFTKDSIEMFGMSELSVKKYASTFQAMGSAMGIDSALIGSANKFLNQQTAGYVGLSDSMADVSVTLTKLTADMASFYNVEQKDVADDLSAIFTGQTRPLRQYGIDLTQATLKEWAMSEGMNANIESMTQAEKTMLRYQYVLAHTGAAQGDFARTVDTWANQVRILKQNFEQLGAVVGGTLINMLKPLVKALNAAMSHIIAFAQVVSNALGKIFGWTYESGTGGVASDMEMAADESETLAGGLSSAEKSAKKLKNHLLSIDELNVFDPEDASEGSGGSGGSGAGGGASSNGGQWNKTESILEEFESELDTLYKLGEHIGNVLSEAMERIDWKKSYEKARNWGKGLADFLNGLISPRLFENVGKTIAGVLNSDLHLLNSFGKTFEWDEFGRSISAGIKGFLETWDAELTAETLSTFASSVINSLKGAIDEMREGETFKIIGQKIVDFICGIDWEEIAWDLAGLFDSFYQAMLDFPVHLAEGIAQGIVDKMFGEGTYDIDLTKVFDNLRSDDWITLFNPIATKVEKVSATLRILQEAFSDTSEVASKETKKAKDEVSKNYSKVSEIVVSESQKLDLAASQSFSNLSNSVSEETGKMTLYGTENFEKLKREAENDTNKIREKTVENFKATAEAVSLRTGSAKNASNSNFESMQATISQKTTMAKNSVKSNFETMANDINSKTGTAKNSVKSLNTSIGELRKHDGSTVTINVPTSGMDKFRDAVSGAVGNLKELFKYDGKSVNVSTRHSSSGGPVAERYATGGYPQPATFFWAGENGVPEMLGTVGGKTAVAGGAEITGIRQAVYDVGQSETALLSSAISILQAIAGKETSVNIDGRSLVDEYGKRKNRNGFSFT